MLISQMIKHLEQIKSKHGDLPIYYLSDEWSYPVSHASLFLVDNDFVSDHPDNLSVGMPIVTIG